MTWLAWRQMRAQVALAVGLTLAITVVLAITHGTVANAPDPGALSSSYQSLRLLGTVLIAVPAVIGAFWGAPLVARELETGTFRLAWTQSVTRTRWLWVKLAGTALAAAVVTAGFTAVFTWWVGAYDRVGNRIGTANFGQRGIVPIAYALFALALGTAFGMLWRRTLPAMASTVVVFIAVRFAFQLFVRSHLLPVVTVRGPIGSFGGPTPATKGAWVLSTTTVDAAGRVVTQAQLEHRIVGVCRLADRRVELPAITRCATRAGFHDLVRVHPARQFWALQGIEAAIFVGAAVMIAGACFWWIRTRAA